MPQDSALLFGSLQHITMHKLHPLITTELLNTRLLYGEELQEEFALHKKPFQEAIQLHSTSTEK